MCLGVCLRRAILALALVAPLAAQQPTEPALWRFADPNSRSAIGIDWARIRNSPAGAMIRERFVPHALPGLPASELLDSIDRLLIASPAGPFNGSASSDSPILIAIQGRFDAAQVRQFFTRSGAKAQSYNSFQVYRPQARNNRDNAYVLYDVHTILYGDAPLVFAALDRNEFGPPAGQAPTPGSVSARAGELDAKYEIWAVLDSEEIASSDAVADLFRGNEWASATQRIEAGLNLGAGLDADITLRFASDEVAKHVTADLAGALNALAKDNTAGAQAQALAKELRLSVDGPAAKLSLHLNEQELLQAARAFSAGEQATQRAAATNPAAAPAPAPVAPAAPPVIRIEGLDEGTREIPYQPARQ